jgi:hypothetical protein
MLPHTHSQNNQFFTALKAGENYRKTAHQVKRVMEIGAVLLEQMNAMILLLLVHK